MDNTAEVPSAPTPGPSAEVASLESVLRLGELGHRSTRSPDLAGENAAYLAIARELAGPSESVLQTLMDAALTLCGAGTAGISLLEPQADQSTLFRWTVLSGRLAEHVNGTTPRDFSPCGVCLDRDEPTLFAHPERRFTYFQAVGVPFVEALVLPFYVDRRLAGTIWIIVHDTSRRFDLEDVRIMSRLAAFTGAAYGLMERARGSA
jgi:hypothetical protein